MCKYFFFFSKFITPLKVIKVISRPLCINLPTCVQFGSSHRQFNLRISLCYVASKYQRGTYEVPDTIATRLWPPRIISGYASPPTCRHEIADPVKGYEVSTRNGATFIKALLPSIIILSLYFSSPLIHSLSLSPVISVLNVYFCSIGPRVQHSVYTYLHT